MCSPACAATFCRSLIAPSSLPIALIAHAFSLIPHRRMRSLHMPSPWPCARRAPARTCLRDGKRPLSRAPCVVYCALVARSFAFASLVHVACTSRRCAQHCVVQRAPTASRAGRLHACRALFVAHTSRRCARLAVSCALLRRIVRPGTRAPGRGLPSFLRANGTSSLFFVSNFLRLLSFFISLPFRDSLIYSITFIFIAVFYNL